MVKTINSKTKISQLLEVDRDQIIKTLIQLNKKFSKLKNPILRNLLAKRVTIADACKISNTAILDFMQSMKHIGFKIEEGILNEKGLPKPTPVFHQPFDYLELDVRPLLAQGKDPLKEILATVKKLENNQGLKLINTFEPIPLINLLATKGFSYLVETKDPHTIITYFNKTESATNEGAQSTADALAIDNEKFDRLLAAFPINKINYLDVRELEMPKPMLKILEQTPYLTAGNALFIYHKKIPVYLLPELEKQELKYIFKDIAPGNINMLIYKI